MSFLTAFLKKNLGAKAEESSVESTEATGTEETTTEEETPAEEVKTEESSEESTESTEATEESTEAAPAEAAPEASAVVDPRAEFSRMANAFGPEFAGIAFAKGLDYASANDLYTEGLKAENASLKDRLAALGEQGEEPVAASPVGKDDKPATGGGTSAFREKCKKAVGPAR